VVSGFGGVGVESFWVLRATVACKAPGRVFPMLPQAGGLSVDVFRIEAALPGAGPVRRLDGRFGESPGSGDRNRVPNFALAVDWIRRRNIQGHGHAKQ
jgi:hypothetical protein